MKDTSLLHGDTNLADRFDEVALQYPDRVAIIADRTWRYGDLRERVLAYAQGLATFGLAPETTVAVLLPRNGDMVAVLLAALRCGLAYTPIDLDDPPERGRRVVRSASCKIVIAEACDIHALRSEGEATSGVLMLTPGDLIERGRGHALPECAPGGARLAYLLFTSGSTGEPKGVEIEHRQLAHLISSAARLLKFSQEDRYLAIATIAFDISVVELFLPLVSGASLLLRGRAELRNPSVLIEEIKRNEVSIVQLGPSAWSVLLDAPARLPDLRVSISTGEPIAPDLARKLVLTAKTVFNLYGPTETTVWATGCNLSEWAKDEGDLTSSVSAPIGVPLLGYDVLIVDENGTPVSDGVVGELLIGGAGVARGYRGNADLSAKSFVAFGKDGHRYYRTGDLVSRTKRGALEYFGRRDDQLKIRGVRIEPREIEGAVEMLPEVARSAATWFTTANGSRGLVVAVVWAGGRSLNLSQLQKRLALALPPSMIPSRLVSLDELPISASGKIDRAAIRAASDHTADGHSEDYAHVLARSDTEGRLILIWRKALEMHDIEPETHFFESGGDSLLAMSVVIDVENVFGVSVPPDALFSWPRFHDFARIVERNRNHPVDIRHDRTVFPVVAEGTGAPLFFSNINFQLAQRGHWNVGCPLYAVSQWALGKGFVKANSIEALAAAQIKEIRKLQPRGPYRVGGYSMGGLIATEIAAQLQEHGQEVELLFLLDPMAPVRYVDAKSGAVVPTPGFERPPLRARLRVSPSELIRAPRAEGALLFRRLIDAGLRLKFVQWGQFFLVDLYGKHPSSLTRLLLPKNRWGAFWFLARKLSVNHIVRPYSGKTLAIFHDRGERLQVWSSLLGEDARIEFINVTHLGMFTTEARQLWMDLLTDALSDKTG